MDNQVGKMREQLGMIYSYVDDNKQRLKQDVADKLLQILEQLNNNINSYHEMEALLSEIDNNAVIMQRSLTHLEEENDVDSISKVITSLLKSSLHMALVFFPAQQLQELAEGQNSRKVDILRKRWSEWLGELVVYLSQLIPLVKSLEEIKDNGIFRSIYRDNLQELARYARELALIGIESKREKGQMAFLKDGPLGDRMIWKK